MAKGSINAIKGSQNIALGEGNTLQGNENAILGSYNIGRGNGNKAMGEKNVWVGDLNQIKGNHVLVSTKIDQDIRKQQNK